MARNLIYIATFALIATILYLTQKGSDKNTFLYSRESSKFDNIDLKKFSQLYDVPLKDQNDKDFLFSQLRGKVAVVSFFFTNCHGPCPLMNRRKSVLHKRMTDKDLKFISISVDPRKDTLEIINSYARKYSADLNRWYFLRGSIETIKKLVLEQFHFPNEELPNLHSNKFILIDKEGYIRGHYDSHDVEDVEQLTQDVEKLLNIQISQS